jgi:trigger factor
METHVQKIEEGKIELSVHLNREELQRYVDRIEREALSELEVDGFRKGKVPQDMGRKQLDAQKVLQAALQDAMEKSLSEAIEKENLDVYRAADLTIKENSADSLKYTVQVILFPKAELPELVQFTAKRRDTSVTDTEIDETIEVLRGSRSSFTDKATAAVSGDRVEVDFQVKLDGKLIEGGDSKNHPLIIGGKGFIPGFEDQLIGMKPEDKKEFSLTAPEDYYHKEIAGKKLDFDVTMKKVQSVEKPEINDAFAQQLGKFTNLDQLRGGIREGISEEKRVKEQQRVRLEILDQIIEKMEIKLPEAFVEDQLDTLLVNFERDLAERGMELGMYLAQMGKTRDDLKKEWRPEAERQAKISFVIHKVAQEKGLVASPEEVTMTLTQQIQALAARGAVDPSQIDLASARRAISDQLTNEKALQFIEGICVK